MHSIRLRGMVENLTQKERAAVCQLCSSDGVLTQGVGTLYLCPVSLLRGVEETKLSCTLRQTIAAADDDHLIGLWHAEGSTTPKKKNYE